MRLRQLFTDDDAVSPVIGVILMVAITVILAAVIGAFVLGFGDSTSSAPQASFTASNTSDEVTFTLDSAGDNIDGANLEWGGSVENSTGSPSEEELSAGGSVTYTHNDGDLPSNGTISLVWNDGDTSSTLHTHELDG